MHTRSLQFTGLLSLAIGLLAGCGEGEQDAAQNLPLNSGLKTDERLAQLEERSTKTQVSRDDYISKLLKQGKHEEAQALRAWTLTSPPCWDVQQELDGYSSTHNLLFDFILEVSWCGDGTTITAPNSRNSGHVYSLLWKFDHSTESHWGGGTALFNQFAQGFFDMCIGPYGIGCVQQATPSIKIVASPDGAYATFYN